MRKIITYLTKQEWLFITISFIFIVTQVWLDLKLPDYMAEITTLIQTEGTVARDLTMPAVWMLSCAIGSMFAAIIVGFFAARVAVGMGRRLRGLVFHQTMNFSMKEMNHFSTPSLITRSTNDITQVQMIIVMGLQVMIKAPILAIWAIIKIYNKNFEWTLATGVALLVLVTLIIVIVLVAIPKFRMIQQLTDQLNRITREGLTGIRVIRAYNAESYQQEKFEQANEAVTSTNLFVNRLMALIGPTMMLLMSGLSVAIYWIGAYLIYDAKQIDRLPIFSNMVVFSSYAMQVIMAFMMVSMIFIMLPRAQVSARRIVEVLHMQPSIENGQQQMQSIESIALQRVSFTYPNGERPVLKDITFEAKKGEQIAFIGSTGSGKTSIVQLIPRFYDASVGEVQVNGQAIQHYDEMSLRSRIGYVAQTAILFQGSVASNVAFADEWDEDKVRRALELADGMEFVERMDGQLDAEIAQGGKNLSGGQRQRLSIARAIYAQPDVLIFDDSFSALDYATDRRVRTALKDIWKETITFIVAQRISTIRDADQIIVLEHGEIVGQGTHEQLLRTCPTYQEIAHSQLTKEELADGESSS